MVLVQFSTSKQTLKLSARGHAMVPRVWLGSLELIQSQAPSTPAVSGLMGSMELS